MARIVSIEEWQEILALNYNPSRQETDIVGFARCLQKLINEGIFNLGEPGSFYLERFGLFAGERFNSRELYFADRQTAENFVKARGISGIRLLQMV